MEAYFYLRVKKGFYLIIETVLLITVTLKYRSLNVYICYIKCLFISLWDQFICEYVSFKKKKKKGFDLMFFKMS